MLHFNFHALCGSLSDVFYEIHNKQRHSHYAADYFCTFYLITCTSVLWHQVMPAISQKLAAVNAIFIRCMLSDESTHMPAILIAKTSDVACPSVLLCLLAAEP